jgi:hypothetical protein
MADVVPVGVKHIEDSVKEFIPKENRVVLA